MNVRNRINLYRRYPHWARSRCIFVHVPKAAGTSINKALYGRTLGHYTAVEIRAKFPRLYDRCFVFSFVRNPWDRVLSAYRFAAKGCTESMGVRNPSQYQIPEFETFERFVYEWLSVRDITQLDYVFQPQHSFVADQDGEKIVEFIGKVENINSDIAVIEEKLDRKIVLPHANRTSDSPGYVSDYKRQDLIDLVARIYEKDIAMFDYKFQ